MPLYDYRCASGHTIERLRKYDERDDATTCHCGEPMQRTVPIPHCVPDGMYSYAPNIGSESAFERRQDAIKRGVKVMPKIA